MKDTPSLLRFLREGRWFSGLPVALQEAIVERSSIRTYRKGEHIVTEGKPARGLHGVLEGEVQVLWTTSDGREILLYVGQAGIWFGEYAVLSRRPSIGYIVASRAVRALFLSVAQFERIVADDPAYLRAFTDLLCERYATLLRYVAEGAALGPEEWLRTRLLDMAAMRRAERATSGPVTIDASQAQLATMLGVSRQHLNAVLKRLEERGVIEMGYRSIRVLA